MSWYHVPGNQQDTTVCTCVRLSRNLTGYPFPSRLDAAGAKEIIGKVGDVLEKNGFIRTDFADISGTAAQSFAEKRYVTPAFVRESLPHALYLNEPCNLSVAVCEEDHVHIRCILAGLNLKDAFEGAAKVETLLDGAIELAFDETLGYLTASPVGIGTAMEASVILSLPLLTESGKMEGTSRRLSRIGLSIRGLGRGDRVFPGGLCRLSNRVTLGPTEEEIACRLEAAVQALITAEQDMRESIQGESFSRLTDRIRRAEGTLRHAHLLTAEETVELLGLLRLGAAMGITANIRVEVLTALLTEAMPATLALNTEPPPGHPTEEEALRARVVRERVFGNT